MRKKHLQLTAREQNYLAKFLARTETKARKIRRARALLLLHQGETMSSIAKLLDYSYPRLVALKKAYLETGLACLEEKPRSGRPPHIDRAVRAKIAALAETSPPDGRARWSLRLLAEKAVELNLVISHNRIGEILRKQRTKTSPENSAD